MDTVYMSKADNGDVIATWGIHYGVGNDNAAALVALANSIREGGIRNCTCGIPVLTHFSEQMFIPPDHGEVGDLLMSHYCFPDKSRPACRMEHHQATEETDPAIRAPFGFPPLMNISSRMNPWPRCPKDQRCMDATTKPGKFHCPHCGKYWEIIIKVENLHDH